MYNNNYNYYPQQQQTQNYNGYMRTPAPQMLKGRLVASLDEARVAPIDFDGSIFYFPDAANKCIYTKQINLDGTATLLKYELSVLPSADPALSTSAFITRDEFESALAQLRASIALEPPNPEPTRARPVELKTF